MILEEKEFFWVEFHGSLSLTFVLVWTSLVAQLVKNPPAMRETWVRSLGW